MSIGSVFLVWLRKTPTSTAAGFRYFLFHVFGGLFLLAGLLLRYAEIGTFAFTAVAPDAARYFDYIILIGFLVNAAFVPLHAWLPDAYPEATVTGAVFMTGGNLAALVQRDVKRLLGYSSVAHAGYIMEFLRIHWLTIPINHKWKFFTQS